MNSHEDAILIAVSDTDSSFKPSSNSQQAVDLFSPDQGHEEPKTFEFEDSPDPELENPLGGAHDEENPISGRKKPKTIENTDHLIEFIKTTEKNAGWKPTGPEVIKLENVQKTYLLGIEGITAVRGISMSIHRGEFVLILGTSGGGKSS